MNIDAQFLFDNQLIAAVENLIKNSKNELLLISPFIDLDKRIQDALAEKINRTDFKLKVLFGKNENNMYKSIKKDSLDFLKKFPDIEIRYNESLQAKFFLNDTHFILTSLNLYDFSLQKNIESGILVQHTARGLFGKAMDGANNLISEGVSSVKSNVLGIENNEEDPTIKFYQIFESSELKFKAIPVLKNKKGLLSGIVGTKEIEAITIIKDELTPLFSPISEYIKPNGNHLNTAEENSQIVEEHFKIAENVPEIVEIKKFSASKIADQIGIDQAHFIAMMEREGYIRDYKITDFGKANGLELKNELGRDYIAYPEDLAPIKKYLR
ncbi:MAG TPA: phospholipase D-like domain-containing protein [Lutibacter sp.]|nr:phospholipase D-like domain-containing protein [Lutibacter sp.]